MGSLVVVVVGPRLGGWRTLSFEILTFLQLWVPHPSLFSGEGWAGMNLAFRDGSRILPSWRSWFVISNAAVSTL